MQLKSSINRNPLSNSHLKSISMSYFVKLFSGKYRRFFLSNYDFKQKFLRRFAHSPSLKTPQHLPRLPQHSIQLPAPCLCLCRVFAMFQGIHFRTLLTLCCFHSCRLPRFPPVNGFCLLFPLFLRPVFRHDLRHLIIRLNRFVFLHACA